jgi:hypothetical protein
VEKQPGIVDDLFAGNQGMEYFLPMLFKPGRKNEVSGELIKFTG